LKNVLLDPEVAAGVGGLFSSTKHSGHTCRRRSRLETRRPAFRISASSTLQVFGASPIRSQ
jgi:hypothetical protein